MGCCGCGGRATSIFAAIFSLFQACAWIGLAIYGIQIYSCGIKPVVSGSQLGEAAILFLYIVYYFNYECVENDISLELPDGTIVPIKPEENIAEPTERTHLWMIVYVILSVLWIVTSILLLLGAVSNRRGKCGAIMYFPWVLVTGIIIISDVIAAIMYFKDVSKTMGLKELLDFIDVPPPSSTWDPDPDSTDIITAIPSIVLGLVFSRFIVIWIINTALFVYVTMAAVAASKAVSQPTNWKRLSKQELARSSDPKPWVMPRAGEAPSHPPESPYQSYVYPEQPFSYTGPTRMPRAGEAPPYAPESPYQSYVYPEQPFSYTGPTRMPRAEEAPSHPPESPYQSYVYPEQPFSYTGLTRMPRAEEAPSHPPESPYQSYNYPEQPQSTPDTSQHETPKSSLQQASDQRYSLNAMQPKRFGKPQPPKTINRSESFDKRNTPQELRSQLPWSYYQSRDELPPRLQNTHEEEELPPIPVPDYTLHFPKRQRPDNHLQEWDRSTAKGKYSDRY